MSSRGSSKRKSSPTPDRDNRFEYPDPTPVAVPVRFQGGSSHYDEIKQMIRVAMSEVAQNNDFESWEDANDFDISLEDEPDFVSQYEFDDLVPESYESLDGDPSLSENSPEGTVSPEGAKPEPQETSPAETAGGASEAPRPPAGTSASP